MLDEQGIYFFHISFLKEVSEDWLSKGHMGNSAKLFMKLVFLKSDETSFVTCDRTIKDLMTCDRTITEVSKTKYCSVKCSADSQEIFINTRLFRRCIKEIG